MAKANSRHGTSEIPQGSRPGTKGSTKKHYNAAKHQQKQREKKKTHTHSKLETVTLPRPHADNKQHAMFQNSFITIASQRECGCVWERVCVSQLINCLHLWCFFWLSQKRKWLEKPRLPLRCRALTKFRGCVSVCVCRLSKCRNCIIFLNSTHTQSHRGTRIEKSCGALNTHISG